MEWVLVVAIILIIIAFFLGRRFASKPIENNNEKIRKEYEELIKLKEQQETERRLILDKLDSDISHKWQEIYAAEARNKTINEQYEDKLKVIENTKQLADEAAAERQKVLDQQFQVIQDKYALQKEYLQNEVQQIYNELESLKQTKAATIEAARKEKQIKENKDEYCLILPKEEERDIPILKEVQYKVSKPRAIAMCIWSNYYLPIAKEKLPKILGKQDVCGIYKITNLKTEECYIGQARDVKKRIYEHMRAGLGVDTPQGNQLYAAMKEYGLDDFSIELLEECKPEELNKKEKYYIELYQANVFGYNISGGNNG